MKYIPLESLVKQNMTLVKIMRFLVMNQRWGREGWGVNTPCPIRCGWQLNSACKMGSIVLTLFVCLYQKCRRKQNQTSWAAMRIEPTSVQAMQQSFFIPTPRYSKMGVGATQVLHTYHAQRECFIHPYPHPTHTHTLWAYLSPSRYSSLHGVVLMYCNPCGQFSMFNRVVG